MKLLTSTAALSALGPDHRFTTRVVADRPTRRLVLVGGGDPLLARSPVPAGSAYPARADLTTLARATARALDRAGRTRVRLGYDAGLFTGPAVNPRWEPGYVTTDVVSPTTALWTDEGRVTPGLMDRSPDPAKAAATLFATALRKQGITIVGGVRAARAPRQTDGGREVAAVRGAPLAQVVQHVLEVSDNEGAEVLARQVAVARGLPASSVGAARAVRAELRRLGVDTGGDRIFDGSGLSRQNRLHALTLVRVLEAAASPRRPEVRAVVASLPVAGFTGSLADRFDRGDPDALGTVRAKTGTLQGVHALAGVATTRDGAVVAFVAAADRVKDRFNTDAEVVVDQVAGALGGCTCARTP